jgi:hypothetical protein
LKKGKRNVTEYNFYYVQNLEEGYCQIHELRTNVKMGLLFLFTRRLRGLMSCAISTKAVQEVTGKEHSQKGMCLFDMPKFTGMKKLHAAE